MMIRFQSVKSFIFYKLTKVSPTRGFATLLGACSVMWALWVMNPAYESFFNPIYDSILAIAPEEFWASFFFISGVIKIVGVWKRHSDWIRFATFTSMLLWLGYAVFLFAGSPLISGSIVYFTLALMNAWIYLQVRIHPEIISGNKIMPDSWETLKQVEKRHEEEEHEDDSRD